jgi:carboxypeptidase-like protein
VALLLIGVLIAPGRVLFALASTNLKGIVVDASTAERLARVRLRLDNAGRDTVTNDVGEFAFDDLEPGEHTLVSETVGYRLHTEHVVIVAGQTTEVTIALTGDAVRLNESVTVTASDPFTPVISANYKDEYREGLQRIIEAKIAGEEIVAPAIETPPRVVNLMEALKKSLDAVSTTKKKPAKASVAQPAPKRKRA